MQLRELAQKLQLGECDLNTALALEELPEGIGHTFACDCAQFLLEKAAQEEGQDWEKIYIALRTKRDWIEGLCKDEECQSEFDSMYQHAMTCWSAWDQAGREDPILFLRWEVARAVRNALSLELHTALWSARHATPIWQTQRLIWLCEVWDLCGERTPFLMRESMLPLPEPEEATLLGSDALSSLIGT